MNKRTTTVSILVFSGLTFACAASAAARHSVAPKPDRCVVGRWAVESVTGTYPAAKNVSRPFFSDAVYEFSWGPFEANWSVDTDVAVDGMPEGASLRLVARATGTWSTRFSSFSLFSTVEGAVRFRSGTLSLDIPLSALRMDTYSLSWLASNNGPYRCDATKLVYHSMLNETVVLKRLPAA